ncbi:MAG TPA: hypothetical protein VF228_17475 [Iamia sp.]
MPPSAAPRRVTVVVQGELGPALVAAFSPLVARVEGGTTVLEGVATDVDAVITRIGELGLQLLALETDLPPPGRAPPS